MEKEQLVESLQQLAGNEHVITEEEAVLTCAKDYIGYRRYERDKGFFFVNRAACVVKPQNTEDVVKVLRFLNENRVDAVPRTGGSSVTRSIEPQPGGVILDGSDMNGILELNETDYTVTVRCGTPLEYLENYLNKRGYTSGHFPQSLPMAHIGGLIATRSIGQLSTLYGGIEDLVVGLEAVLADGTVIRIKDNPRRSCGPDLRHMFIGSEGMLGFVTEATLKIFPYQPENRWMHAYGIMGMKNGLEVIRKIITQGYRPAVVRLHDESEVETLFGGAYPEDYCLLLFMAEGPKGICDVTGAAIEDIVKNSGYDVIDLGEKPVEAWLQTRNDECDKMDEPTYSKYGAVADTCEISALWSEIGDIYEAVKKRLPEEARNLIAIGGHSSHSYTTGTNIYFTFGFLMLKNPIEAAEGDYMAVIRVIMEETLKRGGSIAHHHGSGKYRTQWMPQEHGSSYELMYRLKEALDPAGILNKGVLLVER